MINENNILLNIKGLATYFPIKTGVFKNTTGHIKAVDGVDLQIYKGETLGIVGESGCGKTTLCKTIVMLNRIRSGEIIWHDETHGAISLPSNNKLKMKAIRQKIQYIFQDPQSSLNPSFTIFGAMDDALKVNGIKEKNERRKIVADLLRAVNMRKESMELYPNELSGGQRQRVGIARALCVNPELVICDEAVSALDVSIQAQVLNLLKSLKKQRNLTYLFITHSLSVVEYISDRVAVMYLGKIVEMGDSEDLFNYQFHPYTQALRSAVPVISEEKTERIPLSGDVPNPANPPDGCSFHTRCWKCIEKCRIDSPPLTCYWVNGKKYYVACHIEHEALKKYEVNENE